MSVDSYIVGTIRKEVEAQLPATIRREVESRLSELRLDDLGVGRRKSACSSAESQEQDGDLNQEGAGRGRSSRSEGAGGVVDDQQYADFYPPRGPPAGGTAGASSSSGSGGDQMSPVVDRMRELVAAEVERQLSDRWSEERALAVKQREKEYEELAHRIEKETMTAKLDSMSSKLETKVDQAVEQRVPVAVERAMERQVAWRLDEVRLRAESGMDDKLRDMREQLAQLGYFMQNAFGGSAGMTLPDPAAFQSLVATSGDTTVGLPALIGDGGTYSANLNSQTTVSASSSAPQGDQHQQLATYSARVAIGGEQNTKHATASAEATARKRRRFDAASCEVGDESSRIDMHTSSSKLQDHEEQQQDGAKLVLVDKQNNSIFRAPSSGTGSSPIAKGSTPSSTASTGASSGQPATPALVADQARKRSASSVSFGERSSAKTGEGAATAVEKEEKSNKMAVDVTGMNPSSPSGAGFGVDRTENGRSASRGPSRGPSRRPDRGPSLLGERKRNGTHDTSNACMARFEDTLGGGPLKAEAAEGTSKPVVAESEQSGDVEPEVEAGNAGKEEQRFSAAKQENAENTNEDVVMMSGIVMEVGVAEHEYGTSGNTSSSHGAGGALLGRGVGHSRPPGMPDASNKPTDAHAVAAANKNSGTDPPSPNTKKEVADTVKRPPVFEKRGGMAILTGASGRQISFPEFEAPPEQRPHKTDIRARFDGPRADPGFAPITKALPHLDPAHREAAEQEHARQREAARGRQHLPRQHRGGLAEGELSSSGANGDVEIASGISRSNSSPPEHWNGNGDFVNGVEPGSSDSSIGVPSSSVPGLVRGRSASPTAGRNQPTAAVPMAPGSPPSSPRRVHHLDARPVEVRKILPRGGSLFAKLHFYPEPASSKNEFVALGPLTTQDIASSTTPRSPVEEAESIFKKDVAVSKGASEATSSLQYEETTFIDGTSHAQENTALSDGAKEQPESQKYGVSVSPEDGFQLQHEKSSTSSPSFLSHGGLRKGSESSMKNDGHQESTEDGRDPARPKATISASKLAAARSSQRLPKGAGDAGRGKSLARGQQTSQGSRGRMLLYSCEQQASNDKRRQASKSKSVTPPSGTTTMTSSNNNTSSSCSTSASVQLLPSSGTRTTGTSDSDRQHHVQQQSVKNHAENAQRPGVQQDVRSRRSSTVSQLAADAIERDLFGGAVGGRDPRKDESPSSTKDPSSTTRTRTAHNVSSSSSTEACEKDAEAVNFLLQLKKFESMEAAERGITTTATEDEELNDGDVQQAAGFEAISDETVEGFFAFAPPGAKIHVRAAAGTKGKKGTKKGSGKKSGKHSSVKKV